METLIRDVRHGARALLRRPAFTLIAAVTLALGIGANTAIFTVVRAVLLEPLPYQDPDRLTVFWEAASEAEMTWLSDRELLEYRKSTRSFSDIAGYTTGFANLTDSDQPERVPLGSVSGNLFATLGVSPQLGRAIQESDAFPGNDVAMISHTLWQRRFGGAPDVVGQTMRVNGNTRTVIGVMPSDFRLPLDYRSAEPSELWTPLVIDEANPGDFGDRSNYLIGRLAPGVTPEVATQDLAGSWRQWVELGYVMDEAGLRPRQAVPITALVLGPVRTALVFLFGAVGLVLVIACANVANLLLARSDARRKEMATRAALGAGRARLLTQLLTESALLAMPGALLGLLLAFVGVRALVAVTPAQVIAQRGVAIDGAVLGYSVLLALATTVLAGLIPALQLSRASIASVTSGGARGTSEPVRKGFRRVLVTAQTALAVMLVVGGALLVRSLSAMNAIDLGFDEENVLTARVALQTADYPSNEAVLNFYDEIEARLRALPGVESVGATRLLPLSGTIGDWSITVEGREMQPGENPNGDWQVVTPGYLETMGVRVEQGRSFEASDRAGAPLVALVNETMAERYWNGDAVGKRFHLGTADQPWMTIVGVVNNVRHNAIIEEERAEMYVPHGQFSAQTGFAPRGMSFVVKTNVPALSLAPALRREIRALDPRLPVADVRTMEDLTATALARPRFMTTLLGAFAALALLLAAIGLYGVVSFMAARRTHEVGVRMALGASRSSVLGMFMREGVYMGGVGVLLGLVGAAALSRVIAGQLYGVQPLDPISFAIAPVVLLAAVALASLVPARRAARTSPLEALRQG